VRAFRSVGGDPIFIKKAKGSKIFDADGKAYIDYVLSWGPMILGHAHPKVTAALKKAIVNGTSFGAPTELEITLARMVKKAVPSIEMVRMVSSGTEATMSAIRAARGSRAVTRSSSSTAATMATATLLVKAGSGVATFGLPDSRASRRTSRSTPHRRFQRPRGREDLCKPRGRAHSLHYCRAGGWHMGCVPPAPGSTKDSARSATSTASSSSSMR